MLNGLKLTKEKNPETKAVNYIKKLINVNQKKKNTKIKDDS